MFINHNIYTLTISVISLVSNLAGITYNIHVLYNHAYIASQPNTVHVHTHPLHTSLTQSYKMDIHTIH